ncbi:nucleotidyltransferase family protein [Tunturiibacter empetritectus]|uniref:nucleotidyltransferase family protein n=2 Tax=Tunturiibacter empetritectus TaxID=3069691 RepID=UPI00211C6480|nr:nucleotidyltransferase family protein [Edaphobacter lichenicola]
MCAGCCVRRIGAVILAAGASRRLGEPKQLVMVGAEILLERSVRVAHEAGFSPVIVVLGASAESIEAVCALRDAEVLINDNWSEGMGASVRVGVGALRDVDGCVLTTCDMPAVTAAHLRSLVVSGEVTGSMYAGRRGVPAYFPATSFEDLMKLQGDAGAKDLLRSARCVALADGELDVDTIEDLKRARALFG